MNFECNSRVEKIPYNGKETIVDGENTALCTEIAIGTFKKNCCLTGSVFSFEICWFVEHMLHRA